MARFLLLHAFPLDSSMWGGVAQLLRAEGHVVLTPDLPGFGHAPLATGAPDMTVMVEEALAVLGERPAVIVGCSMGGYVALGIARRRPDLVAALGLVDTKATADAAQARSNRERLAAMAESGGTWSEGMVEGLLGDTSRRTRPEVVARVEEALAGVPGDSVAWAQRAMAARPDAREALGALTAPVLAVWGEEDSMSPWSEQQIIMEAAPQAVTVRVARAGHLTPLEAPSAVAQALTGLVA